MSHYTTEVRFICETAVGLTESAELSQVDDIIELARSTIFNNYPIFDEAYRSVLECKILKHYYTREISEEVVGLWKLRLHARMSEIMPYYNKLYESELIKFNPLYDTDVTKVSSRNRNTDGTLDSTTVKDADIATTMTGGESHTDTESGKRLEVSIGSESYNFEQNANEVSIGSNSKNDKTDVTAENTSTSEVEGEAQDTNTKTVNGTKWDKYSDTPQGGISGIDSDTYLTNARKNTDNTTTTDVGGNTTSSTTENSSNSSTSTESSSDASSNTATDTKSTQSSDTSRNNAIDTINDVSKSKSIEKDSTLNTDKDETTTRTDSTNYKTIDDYIDNVTGKQGSASYSKLLTEFRDTFLNIDLMIINALSDLFFNLW